MTANMNYNLISFIMKAPVSKLSQVGFRYVENWFLLNLNRHSNGQVDHLSLDQNT